MTDANDPGSFVELAVISNNGSTGHRKHVIDFSQFSELIPDNAKFIAFRNFYNGNWGRSINYLDDINLYIPEQSDCGISELPAAWGFEADEDNTAAVAECWTLVNRDKYSNTQYDPHIINQTYYANSGSASLKLDGEGLFAMPEFKVNGSALTDVTMEISVRQYSDNCKLRVGVMTDANDPDSFVELAVISNNGTIGHLTHVIDFSQYSELIPENAKFIAFRNFYNGNWGRSINYLDDINLFVAGTRDIEVSDNSHGADDFDLDYDADFALSPLGVDEFDISDFTVYPNPTTGLLTLGMEAQRVEVTSLTGQKVALFENTSSIDISSLPAGVYILKATLPQGTAVRKVVKR